MQAGFFRHAARQSSIGLPLFGAPTLEKLHKSSVLTLELKHAAPALIMFALLHIQIETLKKNKLER